jgi:tetratricopeptide (TPR) repeat protein
MATLFLSYAHEDIDRVQPLAAALESEGHKAWWDRHISGGQQFSEAIEQALDSADIVIACWTATSIKSGWVRDEAAAGRDSNRLIPVTLDGCKPPLGFRQYQTIDLSAWNGRPKAQALNALKSAINERTGAAAAIEAAKPAPVGRPRFGLHPRQWAAAATAVLLLLVAGVFLYGRAEFRAIEPRVAVGRFALVSTGLPSELPNMLYQEIVAAFGAENAVTVVEHRSDGASAPFVMDGSLSRDGNGVRVTINLKNRRSGVVLWSRAYEHEAANAVAARQAAVGASQVVRCGLWGASSYNKLMSDQALALYFQWCNEHWSGSASGTAELDAARRVTVSVPDFSFGWSALALAAVPLAAETSSEAKQLHAEAMAAARKSMQLDRQNPEGYMAIAGLLPLDRYAAREELLKKAISVRPTECGCERQAYGDFLASVGRMQEAVKQYERARAMRPLAPFSNLRFAQALYMIGRTDEADRVLTRTLELWPNATSLRLLKIKSALWTDRYDEAIALLRAPDLPLTSTQRDTLAGAFEALKSQNGALREKSIAGLERFAMDARYNDRLVVGTLAALGAPEAAIKAATNLLRTRGLFEAEILFEPNLAAASQEPAYAELVRKLGLTTYWREAQNSPDICREARKPPFCSFA